MLVAWKQFFQKVELIYSVSAFYFAVHIALKHCSSSLGSQHSFGSMGYNSHSELSLCTDHGSPRAAISRESCSASGMLNKLLSSSRSCRAQVMDSFTPGSCSPPKWKQASCVHPSIPVQSLLGSNALWTILLHHRGGFLQLWLWEVWQRKHFLPTNRVISWQTTLVTELWICVGLFLFATSATLSILKKVSWPLSSTSRWQDGIHNECTSGS